MGGKNLSTSVLWRRADGATYISPGSGRQHSTLPQLHPMPSEVVPGDKSGLDQGGSGAAEKADD